MIKTLLTKLSHSIKNYRPSPFELLAIAATIAAIIYYLSTVGVTWRTIALTVAMLIAGGFMGDLARRLWFGY